MLGTCGCHGAATKRGGGPAVLGGEALYSGQGRPPGRCEHRGRRNAGRSLDSSYAQHPRWAAFVGAASVGADLSADAHTTAQLASAGHCWHEYTPQICAVASAPVLLAHGARNRSRSLGRGRAVRGRRRSPRHRLHRGFRLSALLLVRRIRPHTPDSDATVNHHVLSSVGCAFAAQVSWAAGDSRRALPV